MEFSKGRQREIRKIKLANRAVAVGKLMLQEISSWEEFLSIDTQDLQKIPRRNLKAGKADVDNRILNELNTFCKINFLGMTNEKLSELYEDIKKYRGLELPRKEFEEKYAKINDNVIKGNPAYLTISISLWGLQFKYPEDALMKDIKVGIELSADLDLRLKEFECKRYKDLLSDRDQIRALMQKKQFAVRATLISCFNLLETYLNGIAWSYLNKSGDVTLSNRKLKLLKDTSSASLREKLIKYPEIINGQRLWEDDDDDFNQFVNIVKPFRDSLIHPSPFSTPEKFGGYDKLRAFYRIDFDILVMAVYHLINIIHKINQHITGRIENDYKWYKELKDCFEKYFKVEIVD